jgi:hypothetical protein
MEILTHTLIETLRYCMHAAAGPKDHREFLRGVTLHLRSGVLELIGSDGYRIAQVRFLELPTGSLPLELWGTLATDGVANLLRAVKVPKAARTSSRATLAWDQSQLALSVAVPGAAFTLPMLPDSRVSVGEPRPYTPSQPWWRQHQQRTDSEPSGQCGLNLQYLAEGAKALSALANAKYHGGLVETAGPLKCGSMYLEAHSCPDFPEIERASLKIMGMRV